jgi:carbon monoxide dehydrogenase subunit G
MKEVARGTAAITCLPSKDELNNAYFELRARIDQIVSQAEQQGSLAVAISGLNSIRHTLDSLTRLAGYDRPIGSQVNVAVQTNVNVELTQITERLIQHFDHEPELKARIAQALLEIDDEQRS